ncbi:MAG: SusC/RagA family TonB-linked outer membrane protein [Polaribacter sp.]|uniref:SusC/RagA family TonB-linked outer membrane protein n=1 Tax=Polaribacter sp. TaxID=1920175 RepID=UPI002F356AEB
MKTRFKGILTLLLAFLVQVSFAQEKTVSGTVSDTSGSLPGVSVSIKGTSKGTQTDFNGKYSIKAKQGDVLSFSYVGYKTIDKTVGTSNTIDIAMVEDASTLEEIVITAYGIKREKKSIGFSQQTVAGPALTQAKETDLSNALAGKVSGVQIIGNSSSTFGNSTIRLRGSDNVLYVVDGIRVYSTSDINTENIASMSVLKGAAATAVYGPDGRNGVIVITSKVATKGETTFELDFNTSVNTVATLPDYQNEYGGGYSQTWDTFSYNAATDPASWASFDGHKMPLYQADESWGPKLDGTLVRHWDSWVPNTPEFGELRPWVANEDNVKNFFDAAITQFVTLAFSKGGEDYNVRTTISDLRANGIIPNSNRSSSKFSINLSYDMSEKFKLFTNINYEDRHTLNDPDQGYGNLASNMNQWWQRQLDMSRLRNYERNGALTSWNINGPRNPKPLYWDSPFLHSYENFKNQYKNSTFGKIGGTYTINDKFNVTGEVRRTFHSYTQNDRGTTKSLLDTSFYAEFALRNERIEYFGMVNYADKYLDGDLDFNASLGAEKIQTEYNALRSNTVGGLTIPGFYNLAGSKDAVSSSNFTRKDERRGLFVKGSLGYKSTLYLDGSYRFDWSSTAKADDNRVETFGTSLSFLANKVIPKNDVLTFSKIRLGYAQAPYFPNPYNVGSTYNVGDLYNGNGTLSVPGRQENPDLVGGLRTETEIGTELQFFNNRFSLDFTYFNRVDSDIPVTVPLDGSTGYSSIVLNSGKQTSKGIELGFFGDVVKSENFNWNVGVNFATLSRFVNELYPGIESRNLSTYTSNMKLQERVGQEWGLFYGRGFATHTDGSKIFTAGDSYARETNKLLGSLLPDFTGGFTSTMTYKNFGLNLGFDFQSGGKYYSRTERYFNHSGLASVTAGLNDKGNPKRDPIASGGGVHIVGVLQTGTDANGTPISDGTVVDKYVEASGHYSLGNLGNIYENNVHDATYVKLRTVRLNYTFDKVVTDKLKIKSATLGLYANNVWLIYSDLPWIDPSEIEKRSGYNWAEAGQLPNTRTIGLNLNLRF